jgi:hypothetical protein
MAVTETLLSAGYAPSSTGTAYTVPASTETKITDAQAHNNDSSERTLSVYLVPSAGSADGSNLFAELTLAAGESVKIIEVMGRLLETGSTIQHVASVASMVAVSYSGKEIT